MLEGEVGGEFALAKGGRCVVSGVKIPFLDEEFRLLLNQSSNLEQH